MGFHQPHGREQINHCVMHVACHAIYVHGGSTWQASLNNDTSEIVRNPKQWCRKRAGDSYFCVGSSSRGSRFCQSIQLHLFIQHCSERGDPSFESGGMVPLPPVPTLLSPKDICELRPWHVFVIETVCSGSLGDIPRHVLQKTILTWWNPGP